MKQFERIARWAFVLSIVASPGLAQDEILTADHHLLRGHVTSSTSDSVTFEHMVDGRSETLTLAAGDLEPGSFYIVRKAAIGADPAAHVQLGDYCTENGLFTQARNEYIDAAKLDPSLADSLAKKVESARDGTAHQLLEQAKSLQSRGKPDEAYDRALSLVRYYSTTSSAADARALCSTLHGQIDARHREQQTAREDSEVGKAIGQVQKETDLAAKENAKGLASKEQSEALKSFQTSSANTSGR